MYILSERIQDDGTKIFIGEILETGYKAENESWIKLQKDLDEHTKSKLRFYIK